MGVYFLDLVTPWTYLHNTMDKTDIAHALSQTPLTVTSQKTGKYFHDKRKIISP
jgi:hypothetical protein